jgi:hypothetical protein
MELLGKSVTCAILGQAGPQRSRVCWALPPRESICTKVIIQRGDPPWPILSFTRAILGRAGPQRSRVRTTIAPRESPMIEGIIHRAGSPWPTLSCSHYGPDMCVGVLLESGLSYAAMVMGSDVGWWPLVCVCCH